MKHVDQNFSAGGRSLKIAVNYKSFCYYSITYADVICILLTKKSKQTQFSNVSNNTNIKALDIVKGSDVNTFTVVCHELVTFLKSYGTKIHIFSTISPSCRNKFSGIAQMKDKGLSKIQKNSLK